PIVGIQFRYLLLAVGVAEIAVAFTCLFTHKTRLATLLTAYLATGFLAYRVGLWSMHWKIPCSCLGNLTQALHIPPQVADNIMKVVLAYLLIGIYARLWRQWRHEDLPAVTSE
ncbi:MAG TPA: MauE/DoxX family redox-associated membrane protein, partial [Verrucomicrobiae bacterium]